ncbi:DUF2721 domain-containing protein [bacterium]|nr:DUF2721 domain-containing protein [bacterium]
MADLQVALTPLVFVSGMSLFLLVLTNRFQVLTARARDHAAEQNSTQIPRFRHRIYVMKMAIMLATGSVILSLVAVVLGISAYLSLVRINILIVTLMAISSAVLFLVDVSQAANGTLEILDMKEREVEK